MYPFQMIMPILYQALGSSFDLYPIYELNRLTLYSVGEVRHDIRDIDYKFPALKEYNDQSAIYNAARIRKRLQSKHEALDLKVSEFEQ
jgi:hypothetical protein